METQRREEIVSVARVPTLRDISEERDLSRLGAASASACELSKMSGSSEVALQFCWIGDRRSPIAPRDAGRFLRLATLGGVQHDFVRIRTSCNGKPVVVSSNSLIVKLPHELKGCVCLQMLGGTCHAWRDIRSRKKHSAIGSPWARGI